MNDKGNTEGLSGMGACVEGTCLQGCCVPVRGEVRPHKTDLQAIATAKFFSSGYMSSLKTILAPSVAGSLLTGRRNHLIIFLSVAALEAVCFLSMFVAW